MATQTQTKTQAGAKTYVLQGTLLEACSCRTLCRCWIGEDPDGGACDAFNAYHIDKGEINGIDVSGLNYVQVVKIPGNVLVPQELDARHVRRLEGDARTASGDPRCVARPARRPARRSQRPDQRGPRHLRHRRSSTSCTAARARSSVGDKMRATMAPYKSAYGTVTTLRDSLFSTIAGAPAYVSKASEHVVNIPEHGMVWTFKDRNAIQGDFRFEA